MGVNISKFRRFLLFEVHSKFVLDPWVGVWTLLTGVQVTLLPQLPGVQLTDLGNVAGGFFQRYRLKRDIGIIMSNNNHKRKA